MAEVQFDRFELGLDVRQGKSVSDANRLRVLKNANPTTGRFLRKRPCLKLIFALEAGTKGLKGAGGNLNTFHGSGHVTHANSLFESHHVSHPTTEQAVAKVHYCDMFLGYLYCSIEYADGSVWHHYLDGSTGALSGTDKSSELALTLGTVITHDGSPANGMIRGVKAVSTEKWYWEVLIGASSASIGVGIALAGASLTSYVGSDASGWGYFENGNKANNGSAVAYGATYTTGDVIGVALNLTDGTLTFYKNNATQGVAYSTGITGAMFPAASLYTANGVATFRFSAATCLYAPPAGFEHLAEASTYVSDANCPHSKSVVKAVQSLFGPKGENVRFCATNAARDWTTASDAGFLPVGLQAEGTTEPLGVGTRKEQLAVYFVDGVQVWNVDPDPAKMVLASRVGGVGSRFPKTSKLISGDLFFLSDYGFKSITVTEFETNLRDIDIGSPIDDLIRGTLSAADDPLAVYYQANGQYLVIFPTYAWCFSFSRSAKLAGWSQYTFPFTINDATELNAKVYLRSGDDVYELDEQTHKDGDSSIPLVEIEMPFVDMKLPGHRKMFYGFDFVGKGTAKLRFRLDPRKGREDVVTDWTEVSGDDTREGPQYPMFASCVSIAPVVNHQDNEEFELHALRFYFEDLGPA
jgi:hypothetical protein